LEKMANNESNEVLSKRVLADCNPDSAFWMCNGTIVRNVYELANAIESMNKVDFVYHVNDDHQKNDFAKWIEAVLEDPELARRLQKIRNQKKYVQTIRNRIKELEAY